MAGNDDAGTAPRSDPLTSVVMGFLGLVAGAGTLFCLVYAVWWLVVFWAPT
jgi:hypothetical protein